MRKPSFCLFITCGQPVLRARISLGSFVVLCTHIVCTVVAYVGNIAYLPRRNAQPSNPFIHRGLSRFVAVRILLSSLSTVPISNRNYRKLC